MLQFRTRGLAAAALLATFAALAPVSASAQEIENGVYKIDTSHSSVIFSIVHSGLTNAYGRFNDFEGTVAFDDKEPAKNALDVTIKADTIDTANEKRDQHLKSPDFFNTKQFPEISYKSTKVTKADANTYDVAGDLTMMGVTKPVALKFEVIGAAKDAKSGKAKAGGEAKFTIKRSEFGMTGNMKGLSDEVGVVVAIEAQKQ